MGSISSSSSALRGRVLPLIPCLDCGKTVKQSVSGTPEHTGWTFFKCKSHGFGCRFWHWELEYAIYLVKKNFLQGDAAVDAIGWAEARREELVCRQAEKEAAAGAAGAAARQFAVMNNNIALLNAIKEVLLLLKIGVCLLCVLCALLIFKK